MESIIEKIQLSINNSNIINISEYLKNKHFLLIDCDNESVDLLNSIIATIIIKNKHYSEFTINDIHSLICIYNEIYNIIKIDYDEIYNFYADPIIDLDDVELKNKNNTIYMSINDFIKNIENINYLIFIEGSFKYKEEIYFNYDSEYSDETFIKLACELYRYLKPDDDIKIALKD